METLLAVTGLPRADVDSARSKERARLCRTFRPRSAMRSTGLRLYAGGLSRDPQLIDDLLQQTT
jgi:hypothetical protein